MLNHGIQFCVIDLVIYATPNKNRSRKKAIIYKNVTWVDVFDNTLVNDEKQFSPNDCWSGALEKWMSKI